MWKLDHGSFHFSLQTHVRAVHIRDLSYVTYVINDTKWEMVCESAMEFVCLLKDSFWCSTRVAFYMEFFLRRYKCLTKQIRVWEFWCKFLSCLSRRKTLFLFRRLIWECFGFPELGVRSFYSYQKTFNFFFWFT